MRGLIQRGFMQGDSLLQGCSISDGLFGGSDSRFHSSTVIRIFSRLCSLGAFTRDYASRETGRSP